MRRYHVCSEEYGVEEVADMHIVKVYSDLAELSRLVKQKLPSEQQEQFKDYTFLPIKIGINDRDLTVEATFATTEVYKPTIEIREND